MDASRSGSTAPPAASAEAAPPLDLSHHYSKVTKNREASSMKAFYKYFQIPGIGQLAGGLPHVQYFPFDTLEAQIAKPQRWSTTPNEPSDGLAARLEATRLGSDPAMAPAHVTVPKISSEADVAKKIDLLTALQYGTSQGYPALRSWIRQFTRENLHPNVPYLGGPEIILTCGSTDGFSKVVELIVDSWAEGDPIENRPGMLTEVFAYGNAIANVAPKGVQIVSVEMDGEGMMADGPGGLEDVLANWDPSKGRRPHFMYSVTMGHNPTSGVLSAGRRKAIYALCCQYDIIIVEDDPYWYLQFPSAVEGEAKSRGLEAVHAERHLPGKSSGFEFLDSLTQSYLSVDTEGRVIRLDTFSKIIAPGCRLGWVTTQPAFIERLERIAEVSTQQPSGFVQSLVAEVVMGPQPDSFETFRSLPRRDKAAFSGWEVDGYVRWVEGLRGQYERRMGRMCSILDENCFQLKQSTPLRESDADWGVITKTRLMSFDWPRGGMFIWVRLHFESHPLWQAEGCSVPVIDGTVLSMALLVLQTRKPYLVIVAPGSMFSSSAEVLADKGWAYQRLCFAAESDENIASSTYRYSNAIQKFWRIKDVAEIESLYNELQVANMEDVEGLDNIGYAPIGC